MDREAQTIQVWTRGDYGVVGDWFADASRQALQPLALTPGSRLLDVACGTGAVAIEAARRGATVVGLDLTPAMLEEARRRAAQAGVTVTWRRGSFERLSHLGPFDAVTSAFGVMFASEPQQVAAQLTSACAPGGRIVTVAWHGDGAFGGKIPALRPFLEGLGGGPDVTRWSRQAEVARFFEGLPVRLCSHEVRSMALPFASIDDAFNDLQAYSGPWQVALEALAARGVAAEAEAAIKDHLNQHAAARAGGVALRVCYAVTTWERGSVA